jgi:hypothetical protein
VTTFRKHSLWGAALWRDGYIREATEMRFETDEAALQFLYEWSAMWAWIEVGGPQEGHNPANA